MHNNFDKRLTKLIEDNTSGSRAIAAKAADLFREEISAGRLSPAAFTDKLRNACALLRKGHTSLIAVQKLCDALESALTGDQRSAEERVTNILDRWRGDCFDTVTAAIAHHLLPLIKPGCRILSHSQSSTVLGVLKDALEKAKRLHVAQTIGYPMKEGILMAQELADAGIDVRLIADAGAAAVAGECDLVLFGADSIHKGGVVNKIGSLGISLAAQHFGVPVYAVADSSKLIAGESKPVIERRNPAELADIKHTRVDVFNVYFEVIPLDLFQGIVTEEGIITSELLKTRLKKII